MTVVYLDALVLLNGVMDYLLLLAAGRVAGEPLRRLRLGAGALLGGLYAGAVFLPGLGFLAHPLCRLGAAVLLLLTAYGGSRRLLRVSLVFFAVSAAFGGGIFAAALLGGRGMGLRNGVLFWSGMDLRVILLSAAGCYALLGVVLRRSAGDSPRTLRTAVVRLEGRSVSLTTLVDTGHTLTDPVTGRTVLVAEGERLRALFPPEAVPEPADLRDPVRGLERLGSGPLGKRLRLLPYRAVGVEQGLLLAVRTDGVRVGEEEMGALLAALSPTPVSDGGCCSALIGAQ
ncbi:sigma-E processing peptidase SpoIIGA [Pseudoflavonifractor sp. MSJ-37]|uniref:sigma-E processing peptidase SpoIIGA n=1 Tax=Pseudoflavonifractor sp. MSJ-37 TaxID=2841531 RepID=UPI001C113E89|nr:sigma-E processing peptidase SpoIIGA [Pseudoflavonifractor sp. MSJ-37]MBU5434511.1 sigma-E processing peptidase SpoIIGA [Pseudoflavonifractor sp. MSJ-37]